MFVEPTAAPPVDFYLWLEENFGEEYVAQLAAQDPRIYPSALPMAEALGAGEIAATPWAPPSIVVPAQEAGSPVEFGLSEAGAWGTRYWAGILDNAPHQNAAQLFANFLIGPEGQRLSAQNASSYLEDVEGAFTSNSQVREQVPLDPAAVAAYQERWGTHLFR